MKWILIRDKLLMFVRIMIGLLFAASGFSKLIQPSEYFQIAIGFYEIVPDMLIPGVSLTVPWVELIFGTFLLLGYWQRGAATVLAFLCGIFQLILAQAVIRQLPIDECGCFGGGYIHLTLYQSFALDTVLVLILIQLAASSNRTFSFDKWLLREQLIKN